MLKFTLSRVYTLACSMCTSVNLCQYVDVRMCLYVYVCIKSTFKYKKSMLSTCMHSVSIMSMYEYS